MESDEILSLTDQHSFDDSYTELNQSLFRSANHTIGAFEVLQSLRKDEILCDISLLTDDGTIVHGHKIVLASTSPYFCAMFTNFEESNKNQVHLRQVDSTALILLIDFIYTAQIIITKKNVQVLLSASNFLQLNDVRDVCCTFLQTQLHPKNCLDIKAFANLHNCTELLSITDSYILQHFSEVVETSNQFLSLTPEQVLKFISNDELIVLSEEKVYEYVVKWINHDLKYRTTFLPKLMEHVRFPFISNEYLIKKVKEEPLIKNSLECKDYIIEALYYHLIKAIQPDAIPKSNRTKPRQNNKVILTFCSEIISSTTNMIVKWFDPATTQWHCRLDISIELSHVCMAILNSHLVFAVDGVYNNVYKVDLSLPSPCWVKTVSMLTARTDCGVAGLNDCIYVFGGIRTQLRRDIINSAECFNIHTQKWRMISNMSTGRSNVGVGVLYNRLYVIGGCSYGTSMNYVECYDPSTDTWISISNMCQQRKDVGVGVLDGIIYAVGGNDGYTDLNSVEAYNPSTNAWTLVASMHIKRGKPGVVALDGLLYVLGDHYAVTGCVETYNPVSNTWSMLENSTTCIHKQCGVFIINKPQHFNT